MKRKAGKIIGALLIALSIVLLQIPAPFVKAAQNTNLMDRNYVYVYSRHRLNSAKDELSFIQDAQITDIDDLAGILSKYILTGMTKGTVWAEGVRNGVLYNVVKKMDELVKFWSVKAN